MKMRILTSLFTTRHFMNKSFALAVICVLVSQPILAQISQPVFATKSDSIQYAAITSELGSLFKSKEFSREKSRQIDSLMRLQSELRKRVIGMRTEYLADNNFATYQDMAAGKVKPETISKLSLANYTGKKLPKEIKNCTTLEELELVNTNIRKLNKTLAKTTVKKVYVYNNAAKLRLTRNTSVKDLIIRGVDAKNLPKSYKKFKTLENLDLSRNIGLNTFPNIAKNKQLKKLNLLENIITLQDFKKQRNATLQELNLQKNKIRYVPDAIANFPNLHKLTLNYNELTDVSDAIGTLKHLTEISFYQNKLTAIPSGLYKLQSLTMIDLYYNQIERIEPEIEQLHNLEVLYISNNQLKAIPESIGKLTKLRELYIHNNKLSYLPNALTSLTHLRVLRMNNNYFTTFPEPLLALKDLENLDVAKNNIHVLPEEILNFHKLQILVLLDNPWEDESFVMDMAGRMIKRGTVVHLNGLIGFEEYDDPESDN